MTVSILLVEAVGWAGDVSLTGGSDFVVPTCRLAAFAGVTFSGGVFSSVIVAGREPAVIFTAITGLSALGAFVMLLCFFDMVSPSLC